MNGWKWREILNKNKVLFLRGKRLYFCRLSLFILGRSSYVTALVLCLKCMKLAWWVLHSYFGPEWLHQVSKNDDEKHCFLKWIGFTRFLLRTFLPKWNSKSGINVAPWINRAPGKFGKNNKHSPLNKRSPLLKNQT